MTRFLFGHGSVALPWDIVHAQGSAARTTALPRDFLHGPGHTPRAKALL